MKAFNRNIFRTLLTLGLLFAGTGVMWGNTYYQAKLSVGENTAGGKAYITDDGEKQTVLTQRGSSSNDEFTFKVEAEANDGYHFVEWNTISSDKGSVISSDNNEIKVRAATEAKYDDKSGGSGALDDTYYTLNYTVTAVFAENYYVKVTTASNQPAWGNTYVKYGSSFSGTNTSATSFEDGGYGKETAGTGETFSIEANPVTNYHFVSWTSSGGSLGSTTSASTTFIANTAEGKNGQDNPAKYTVTANYAKNIYYAKLTANTNGNGSASVTSATLSTETQGGSVEFSISATPNTGYHFAGWETSGSGSFGNAASASTTFTASASSNYDEGNAATYTVTAKFEKDMYNAKLNTAASSALEGTKGGSAQVSDGSNWSGSVTKSATTGNQDVSFSVKATPNKGYQFVGWSKNNASTSYIAGLGAEGSYSVKSADSEGSCNEETIYAVFDKGTYKIHFLANSKPESGRTVTGEMSDQTFTSGVAQKLSPLGFVCDYTVTYDAQGGQCSTPYETKSRFTRWKEYSGSETVNTYNDEAEVNRMENHGTTVNLTATWADKLDFTLPTPTKQKDGVDKTFLGWYDAAEGGNKVGAAGAEVEISSTQTLFAHWKECNITISVTGTAEGNMVFNVTRSGTPATHYRVSVPAGGSVTLTDVVPGSYVVAPETGWSWNTQISPETKSIEFNPASTDSETLTAEFTVSSKNSTKKHVEESLVIDSF